MSTTLMIPARVIPRIREGAYAVARDVAERIDEAAGVEELRIARDRLYGVCGLLASLERVSLGKTADVELDGGEYAGALAAVVSLMLPLMEGWLGDLSSDDTSRPACEVEYRMMCEVQASVGSVLGRPGLIVIRADVLGQLREGLFSLLCDIVQGLDEVLVRPAHSRDRGWVGPVARFDRVRSVLDLIGWERRDPEPDVEVDLSWYAQAIKDALARELDSMLHLSEEVDGGQQREWATANATAIERFLAQLGGEP